MGHSDTLHGLEQPIFEFQHLECLFLDHGVLVSLFWELCDKQLFKYKPQFLTLYPLNIFPGAVFSIDLLKFTNNEFLFQFKLLKSQPTY